MADQEDYSYALSGAKDLMGCVLSDADLRNLDLRDRDFGNARLDKADFSNSDLAGSVLAKAKVKMANFSGANLSKTSFGGAVFRVNFSDSNLSGARVTGILNGCNLQGANLVGANFSGAHFDNGCIFDGAIVDGSTNFEGVEILRPDSRHQIFRFFRLERGKLVRKNNADVESLGADADLALAAINEGIRQVNNLRISSEEAPHSGMGHNRPPLEFQISEEEKIYTLVSFNEAKATIESGSMDADKIRSAVHFATQLARASLSWVGDHADTAVSEFSKEFGKTLGGKTALVLSATYFSGAMNAIVESLQRIIG
jgi:uncharacterized protein YjbI with pentapeptide repeats